MGPTYEETKNDLIKEGKYFARQFVRFTYGNTWEVVDFPQAKDGSGKINRWTMELSINDGQENVGKYIESVTYILHPTYRNNVIKVTQPPF